jgi:hypothetical protein
LWAWRPTLSNYQRRRRILAKKILGLHTFDSA